MIAFKSQGEAPDKVEAALTSGPDALVFYSITVGEIRRIATDHGDKLEAFARMAHAESASVLCFNSSLIATLASIIERRVNDLIEAATENALRFRRVDPQVNSNRSSGPELIEPI